MNTRIPMYEGDGFIRPGLSVDSDSEHSLASVPTRAELQAIERKARRARSMVVGGLFARFFKWLSGAPVRANQRALERYVGRPTDVADLERRLRSFERTHQGG